MGVDEMGEPGGLGVPSQRGPATARGSSGSGGVVSGQESTSTSGGDTMFQSLMGNRLTGSGGRARPGGDC